MKEGAGREGGKGTGGKAIDRVQLDGQRLHVREKKEEGE